jgi:hypothetical protein
MDITDTQRLNYIQGLDEPILEIGSMKGCRCCRCRGYTLREAYSGKRSYSEDGIRGAIDAHIRGELEEYEE